MAKSTTDTAARSTRSTGPGKGNPYGQAGIGALVERRCVESIWEGATISKTAFLLGISTGCVAAHIAPYGGAKAIRAARSPEAAMRVRMARRC